MDISKLKTNKDKEQEGVEIDVGEGLILRICRLGNPKYESYVRKIGKPMRHQLRSGDPDPAQAKDIVIKACARHVLVGWENMQEPDENGELQDVQYSIQKAEQLLRDIPDFYRLVLELGNDASLFRDGNDEGNS